MKNFKLELIDKTINLYQLPLTETRDVLQCSFDGSKWATSAVEKVKKSTDYQDAFNNLLAIARDTNRLPDSAFQAG
ncbi:hypothetical protein Ga0466249_002268 [Sporomusaceae bacterium BoRhaA]|uniref:hypothetical protein n=1 Tax=Pelorhabdus rhamnosifermentans TaxID=2772457 RepID=UPI001C061DEC|nr:hypothetical protein [Pelorhabdus rhamnosifermentans]MBU2701154.1 hypothetical protein [Pelorhabdus rhamnosifermentans]